MRPFHKLFIAGALALGALLPGGAQAQYWDKPGYVYAPPPPVYYAPPVVYAPPPRYYQRPGWGPRNGYGHGYGHRDGHHGKR